MTDVDRPYLADDYIDEQDIFAIPFGNADLVDISFDNATSRMVEELTEVFKRHREYERRSAQLARQSAERRALKITKATQRLQLADEWFTSTGERIKVNTM